MLNESSLQIGSHVLLKNNLVSVTQVSIWQSSGSCDITGVTTAGKAFCGTLTDASPIPIETHYLKQLGLQVDTNSENLTLSIEDNGVVTFLKNRWYLRFFSPSTTLIPVTYLHELQMSVFVQTNLMLKLW